MVRRKPLGTVGALIVVVMLDPENVREGMVWLDLPLLGREWQDRFVVHDEVTGATWEWGQTNYVRLDPRQAVAHILSVTR